ncbi:hypothetical protein Q765_03185 [Flavobacterium rivuli WB 3.3-2 = DSM 21788]|uniref:Uncharacterized protein n=1 Tax=Flavobacterium rivuli WB 3.3-2 = DSM 21788 TaxID=1121895 RepID=A0A0A2M715_9FLAO|nr:hypothetical protein [Flavobacterium rivuli]KGO88074.1 hypothetical protein Q765_03185 [Flavobacterium rivuli WB 3.3-2 = DSM 21788]
MSKNIINNIQRLNWRMVSKKAFMPNEDDKAALKGIVEWIDREKENRINNNRYFAKIVIYCLMREIDFFGNMHFAERKIHQVLKFPAVYWYDRFRLQRIMRDFQQSKEVLGIEDISEIWDRNTSENGYLDMDKIKAEWSESKKLTKEHQSILLKSLDSWQQPDINNRLNHFVTELLNEYGNLA